MSGGYFKQRQQQQADCATGEEANGFGSRRNILDLLLLSAGRWLLAERVAFAHCAVKVGGFGGRKLVALQLAACESSHWQSSLFLRRLGRRLAAFAARRLAEGLLDERS